MAKRRGEKERFTKEKVAQALKDGRGSPLAAADLLGCDYVTVWRKMNRYPELKQIREEAREEMITLAEDRLQDKIVEGNELGAIIFFLKTQAKHRGYTERQEVTGKDGQAQEHRTTVVNEKVREAGDEIDRILTDAARARQEETDQN